MFDFNIPEALGKALVHRLDILIRVIAEGVVAPSTLREWYQNGIGLETAGDDKQPAQPEAESIKLANDPLGANLFAIDDAEYALLEQAEIELEQSLGRTPTDGEIIDRRDQIRRDQVGDLSLDVRSSGRGKVTEFPFDPFGGNLG